MPPCCNIIFIDKADEARRQLFFYIRLFATKKQLLEHRKAKEGNKNGLKQEQYSITKERHIRKIKSKLYMGLTI
jgi:hypothetical protein